MTTNNLSDDWWKQAVVYQVYPRSFKDVDGDGIGNISGVTEKMSYLQGLGIDAIWLSPFYPSDLADGGYDVIDYENVDPRLGTMKDFDAMVEAAHQAGLKIMVDIVPNHTSNKHKWFQQALKARPGSAERDRYIFRKGRGKKGELPPNNWMSLFGGPAWEQVEDGQWYLHIFAKEQPDLNWKNHDVHEEFKNIFRFWSDHGTDGFRIDVAHGLAKDLDSKPLSELDAWPVQQQSASRNYEHPLWDRPQVHDIYKEWRQVFNEYNPHRFAVGEAWVVPEHQHLYASEDELGQVFNFEFAKSDWNCQAFSAAIKEGLEEAKESGSTTTWVMNNHDIIRSATRYALPQAEDLDTQQLGKDWLLRNGRTYKENRAVGNRRARAGFLMEAALPGSLYIYQGEELGLFEVADIPWERLEDPTAFRSSREFTEKGRDGCRVPLPWNAEDTPEPADWDRNFGQGASFGFSPKTKADGTIADDPHLPQPLWFKKFAVDVECRDKSSMLNLYRTAIRLRAQLLTAAGSQTIESIDQNHGVLTYTRSALLDDKPAHLVCITNFSRQPVDVPEGCVALSSAPLADGKIPTDTSVWLVKA